MPKSYVELPVSGIGSVSVREDSIVAVTPFPGDEANSCILFLNGTRVRVQLPLAPVVEILEDFQTSVTAILPAEIELNSSTSTSIVAANEERVYFSFSNPSNQDVWLKLQAASVDDEKKGIWVPNGETWRMPTFAVYVGDISAIANVNSPDVTFTEF